jgi:hypothetical protein
MNFDLQDYALRLLFLLAGLVAAIVLTMKGYGQALPGLAVGGILGAFLAHQVESSTTEQ